MCGVAGIVSPEPGGVDAGLLRNMIDTIRYRGPDDSGVLVDDYAGLAHARLSIIDVSGGAQPMASEDGSVWIAFNGEIFNYLELREELIGKGHRFRTRSDTEVLLELYREEGERCVERLNGQWAFAIWDRPTQKLFLSRDRMGIRPLFYARAAGRFAFASEAKALFPCPGVDPELDLEALVEIFTFWTTLAPRTAFHGISELPPGHSLTFRRGQMRVFRYWKPELVDPPAVADRRPEDLAEELRELLLDATRLRLRADVPVGAYLSGGLDSTLVTALARLSAGDHLRTFSVAFDDPEFDESRYQREASAYLETAHSAITCSSADIQDVFPEVVWHAEKPLLRTAPAPLYHLSRLVRDSRFKVVLTGEGADELLGGYDIFMETKIRAFWARQPESARRPLLLKRLYPYMEGIRRQSPHYLKAFFHVDSADLISPFFSHLPRWRLTSKILNFLSEDVRSAVKTYDPLVELERHLPSCWRDWASFRQAEYLESQLLLPGYILSSQGDRVSMAHGVEGRYPFLDHRVVEFAARLPAALKMKVLDPKHLLKRAAGELVPESIRKRYKQPYRAPDGAAFFRPKSPHVEEFLSPEAIRRHGIFDPEPVRRLIEKFDSGRPTGVGDDMALVGILSTQVLLDRITNRRTSPVASGSLARPLSTMDTRVV